MEAAAAAAAIRRNSGSKKGDAALPDSDDGKGGPPPRPLLARNDANGFDVLDVPELLFDGLGKNGLSRPAIDGFEKNETGLSVCGDF